MSRFKATIRLADAGTARAATTALTDLLEPPPDAATCFEDGTAFRVEAYFAESPDGDRIAALLAEVLGGAGSPAVEVSDVPDLNWVAISQAALPPVAAGRFTVHGRHDRARVPRGPWTIEIDAGEAFGTAHHATTLGCLTAIDRLTRRRRFRRVLDLGCGSGVLAIAAARAMPSSRIVASDIDPIAVEVAAGNMAINGCGGRIRVRCADGLPRGRYDLIVANILAGPLTSLAPRMRMAAAPGAAVVLSGLLVHQAAAVSATYRSHGFALVRNERIAGWSALTLINRSGRRVRPKPVA